MKTPHYSVTAMLFVSATLLLSACSGTSDSSGSGSDSSARWRTAELIGDASGDAEHPQIAINDSDDAVVVWAQSQDDGSDKFDIWSNVYSDGTWWPSASPVDHDDADANNPQVAIDADGNAIAVWAQSQDDGSDKFGIWSNRYDYIANDWGNADDDVGQEEDPDAKDPQIAMNAYGDLAIAVWEDDGKILASRYDFEAGNWGWGGEPISNDDVGAQNPQNPQIAMNADGDVVAVWKQNDGIWSSVFDIDDEHDGSWGGLKKISDHANANNPQVAIDAGGNAIVVWEYDDGIWSSNYDAYDGDWLDPTGVDKGADDAKVPQIAIDADGHAIVVWEDEGEIWSNRYDFDAEEWGKDDFRVDNGTTDASIPQVAIDADGNAIAVWVQNDGIWSNRYDFDAEEWGEDDFRVDNDNDDADVFSPQIAMNADGNAIAVWVQNDGIWSNRFE